MKLAYLAAFVTCFALLPGCGPALPPGVNFVAANEGSLVLNLQGEEWRLFVAGADRTQELGLKSTASPAGPEMLTVFQLSSGAAVGLPAEFSLQKTLGVPYECVQCDERLRAWVRQ